MYSRYALSQINSMRNLKEMCCSNFFAFYYSLACYVSTNVAELNSASWFSIVMRHVLLTAKQTKLYPEASIFHRNLPDIIWLKQFDVHGFCNTWQYIYIYIYSIASPTRSTWIFMYSLLYYTCGTCFWVQIAPETCTASIVW
jgi:hypothetical protein